MYRKRYKKNRNIPQLYIGETVRGSLFYNCYPDHYDVKIGTNTARSIVADVIHMAGFSASICRVLVRRMQCLTYLVLNFPKR